MASKEMCDEDSFNCNRLANLHVQKLVIGCRGLEILTLFKIFICN